MGRIVTLTSDLVTALNALSLSQPFTAIPAYEAGPWKLETGQTLVQVVPSVNEEGTRGRTARTIQSTVAVDIAILHKPADRTPATVDPWLDFVEELYDEVKGFDALGDARLASTPVWAPIYSEEELRGAGVFLSVIRIEYRVGG